MADLTEQQKLEIVEALACFRRSSEIMALFQSEYGLEIDRKQIGRYDPQRSYFAGGERWRAIFDARRKAYLEEVSSIPIAHQGFRLNLLNEMTMKAIRDGKPALAAKLLEQAAKEVGGMLTNQHNVRIDDNRPKRAIDTTPEDRRAAMTEIIRQAMEKRAEQGGSIEESTGVQQSARGLTLAACAQ